MRELGRVRLHWQSTLHWFSGRLTEMMRLKEDTPVLQRGLFQVLYAQGDCLIMRRYKEEGRYDAFGEELRGPDLALIAVKTMMVAGA